jgi:single-strand DNA-binding protein
MDLNSVSLTGRLGADAETNFFESGKCLTKFSVAVKGMKKDETHWFNCQYWQNDLSGVVDYLRKGQQVGISGRLSQEKWEDKQTGAKRERVVVIINQITLLGGQKSDSVPSGEKSISKEEFEARKNGTTPVTESTVEASYEDVPF